MLNRNAIKIVVMLIVGGVLGGCQGDTRAVQVSLEEYESKESPAPHGSYVNPGRWIKMGVIAAWEEESYTFHNGVLVKEFSVKNDKYDDGTISRVTAHYVKKGDVYYLSNVQGDASFLFGSYRIFEPWEHGLILRYAGEKVYLVSSSDNYTLPAAENLTGLPTYDELFDKLLRILLFVVLFSVTSSFLFWWMKRNS